MWSWLFESPRFAALAQNAELASRGITNVVTKERITYVQLKSYAEQLSTILAQQYGLQPSATVILISPNTVWYSVAMHSVLRIGGTVGGTSPHSTLAEIVYSLRDSRADYVVAAPEILDLVIMAASDVGIPTSNVLLMEGRREGYKSISQLAQTAETGVSHVNVIPPYQIPNGKDNGQVCGYLSFTSGTTGKPKAVGSPKYHIACVRLNEQVHDITSKRDCAVSSNGSGNSA